VRPIGLWAAIRDVLKSVAAPSPHAPADRLLRKPVMIGSGSWLPASVPFQSAIPLRFKSPIEPPRRFRRPGLVAQPVGVSWFRAA
jgi:hypothetical protein